MTEVKHVGKTYAEHLREVRAKQFGRSLDEISSITSGTTVKVEKPKKTTKPEKEVKADE